ncbi:APC family permease [Candidatus Peribacteria bacterium]|nr:APC family permease [Candidatus Peribacteria bacterium]
MPRHSHQKLSQWFATAICGNDILSSALYVSGIAIIFAGVYAPLVLLLIGGVLYLYKKVYTEVVEALPLNGGAYNCLLNGTWKSIAAVAGVMTLLSYIATAVISAKIGVEYLNIVVVNGSAYVVGIGRSLPILPVTIGVLLFFAVLVIAGVKDSARVALGIFIIHIVTLILFLGVGLYAVLNGHSYFMENFARTGVLTVQKSGLLPMFFLAFSASLLGVSGFESSANFVEEQDKGVFRKTLRNMLIGVAIFNPLIALIVLQSMPYDAIVSAKDFLLADAALAIGGTPLQYLVAIDAFLVLSGAVLTSYIGVSGLLHRMSADNCLPAFFGKKNRRGTFPRIVILFFLLCSSILVVTQGELLSLAGVYTISFLGVMTLFAFGNLVLKDSRADLKRTYRAPVLLVVLAMTATIIGIAGNIKIDPRNFLYFCIYFVPTIAIVLTVIYLDYVLIFLLRITRFLPTLHRSLEQDFRHIIDRHFGVFIHKVSRLQPILDYINRNETGRKITLFHCKNVDGTKNQKAFDAIRNALPHLKKAGFYPHLTIELREIDMPFGPGTIDRVSKLFHMKKNRIFIGSIHREHRFDYSDLGGVRIIFG